MLGEQLIRLLRWAELARPGMTVAQCAHGASWQVYPGAAALSRRILVY